jgi:hypothetical protein
MSYRKNTSGQKFNVLAISTATGLPVTGDATNITAQISLDSGAFAAVTDTNPTELDATNAPGVYVFDLTQAETNGDVLTIVPTSTTANVQIDMLNIYTVVLDDYKAYVGNLATSLSLAVVDGKCSAILTDTGTTIPAQITGVETKVDGVKATTDQFVFTVANQVDANCLTGGLSQTEVAQAVWNADISTYQSNDTFGNAYRELDGGTTRADVYRVDSLSMAAEGLGRIYSTYDYDIDVGGSTPTSVTFNDPLIINRNEYYTGMTVLITQGQGQGQARLITAYDGTTKTATIYPAWGQQPAAGLSDCTILGGGQLADYSAAVWDESLSQHNTAGSTGKALKQLKEGIISYDGEVDDAAATTLSFATNLVSAIDDFYNGQTIHFISGTLDGQSRVINGYTASTKTITVDNPLSSAPADGTEFIILSDHVYPVSEIVSGVWSEVQAGYTTDGTFGYYLDAKVSESAGGGGAGGFALSANLVDTVLTASLVSDFLVAELV